MWSLFFLVIFLFLTRKLSGILLLVKKPQIILLLVCASLMIGINQFGFIYSISVRQVIQASFAYYIFPLIAVFLGFIFLKERFSYTQMVSISLAFLAVIFLAIGLGTIPYISLLLGVTFGIYGLIKTYLRLDPLQTVSIEIILLFPIALGYLTLITISSPEIVFDVSRLDFLMFILSGLITAFPLFLFSLSTSGLNYSTVGIVNYVNPTIQFIVAVVIFLEPFTVVHGTSFCLIWVGLFLYSLDSIKADFLKSKISSSTD